MKLLIISVFCLCIGLFMGYQLGSHSNSSSLDPSSLSQSKPLSELPTNANPISLPKETIQAISQEQQPTHEMTEQTQNETSRSQQGSQPRLLEANPASWYAYEQGIKEVHSESDLRGFLNQVIIPNLGSKLGYLKPVSEDHLQTIQGTFIGRVHFDNASPDWDIEWQMDGHIEDHKILGRAQVILSKDGKPFSNSNGKGDIKFFSTLGNQSQAIFVEANSDHFMQLYFSTQLDQFIGNFYKKEKPSENFQKAGTVTLTKKQ